MALWELDEFQGPRFLGFVRNVPAPEQFAGQRWLPNQTTFDLEFEYIKGVNDRPVMAHVMGWDSEAPIDGRPPLGERVSGELPPIKRKAKVGEKEIIRFLSPRAGTPDKQNAIDSVYRLSARLVESIQARVEWLRIQALSEDKITYNEGGVIFSFDYGIDTDFQWNYDTALDGDGSGTGTGGVAWNLPNTATPIDDLTKHCNAIEQKTGYRPAEIVMSRKALNYLLQNDEIKGLIRPAGAPDSILTQSEVNNVFALYGLPTITTYDVTVRSEQADGTATDVRPLAENKAFLVPSGGVGQTLWGPTAESRPLLGTSLSSQAPGIYAVTYGKEEPPSEWVKAVAVAFPSLPDAHLLGQAQLW
jgi:Phage major capsid protein E